MNYEPDRNLQYRAIHRASESWNHYRIAGEVKSELMVVIDMAQPSYKKRFYLYNNATGEVLREHHVSHGVKSNCKGNKSMACHFSNTIMSRKSNLGALRTGKVYYGKHGRSLNLHGLEKGINSNAYRRRIVIHSAKYVTNGFINRNGRAGNSWGCPALDPAICDEIIDIIKDGVFVYVHK